MAMSKDGGREKSSDAVPNGTGAVPCCAAGASAAEGPAGEWEHLMSGPAVRAAAAVGGRARKRCAPHPLNAEHAQ